MSSILSYRGYDANITYDAEDDMLVGEVINADPHEMLFFGGASIPELHQHFHDVVDTYIESLKETRSFEERKEM